MELEYITINENENKPFDLYFEQDKKVILKSFFPIKGYTDKGIKAILIITILSCVVYKCQPKNNIRC